MSLVERISRGEAAITRAKAMGRDVTEWEQHLEQLKRQSLQKTDATEGRIVAVEICSEVLQAHIWLAFDEKFDPRDGQAVFYSDELEFLKAKSVEQLRKIYETKLAFGPGARVRQ